MTRYFPKTLTALLAAFTLFAVVGPAGAAATSSAELLERAIYAEETVGDLDRAIALYEQIAEDARANRLHVAQAHFRLAQCQARQGRDAEARLALEALVRDFPDQEALVAEARVQLAATGAALDLQPEPWLDGEQLHYRIRLAGGQPLGLLRKTTRAVDADGVPAWRFETRRFLYAASNAYGVSRVTVERGTQRPISSAFRSRSLGDADATYGPVIEVAGGGGATRIDDAVGVFDNEQATALMRVLPLAPGYETRLRLLPIWTGTVLDVQLKVTGRETIEVPAGTFECDVVEVDVDKQKFWYSTGPERRLIRLKAGGAVIELAGAEQVGPEGPLPFAIDDDDFRFAGALPTGWLAHPYRPRPGKGLVRFLDPEAATLSALEFDRCPSKGCPGVEETAERELRGARRRFKDFALRDGSWRELTLDGHRAIAFVGDFDNDGEPWVQYRVYTLTDDTRFEFIFRSRSDAFDDWRPRFDAVLESLSTR